MRIPIQDGQLDFYQDFISYDESISLLNELIDHTPWQQNDIFLFGKWHKEPRLSAWYADQGKYYTYSGIKNTAIAWTDTLLRLKGEIESIAQSRFNSVLLNYYRDGDDGMGYHQDNEKELGQNPTIASLSLGATRTFQLKHITQKAIPRRDIVLNSGSLLVMGGTLQHYWKHQIPKSKKIQSPRINLTFRNIIS